jgi:hypothetical protein
MSWQLLLEFVVAIAYGVLYSLIPIFNSEIYIAASQVGGVGKASSTGLVRWARRHRELKRRPRPGPLRRPQLPRLAPPRHPHRAGTSLLPQLRYDPKAPAPV